LLLLGIAGSLGTLLVWRFIGSPTGLLPPPFGEWPVHYKYLEVSVGFASLASAVYPRRSPDNGGLLTSLMGTGSGTTAHLAASAFFFHFPVIMLVFAVATALLQQPAHAAAGRGTLCGIPCHRLPIACHHDSRRTRICCRAGAYLYYNHSILEIDFSL
jgi:hypothetical protein